MAFTYKLLFVLLALPGAITAQISSNIKLDYQFSGNANDGSSGAYNGTVYGGATLTTDRFGNPNSAYSFDGVDDYIAIGTTPFFSSIYNSFTISFWKKSNATGINRQKGIFGSINSPGAGMAFNVLIHGSNGVFYYPNTVYFYLRDDDGKAFTFTVERPELFDDNWHCVTIVINNLSNEDAHVYIDGVHYTPTIHVSTNPSAWSNFEFSNTIGVIDNRGTPTDFYRGSLDEFKVFDFALDQSEVQMNCSNTWLGNEEEELVSFISKVNIYPNPSDNGIYSVQINDKTVTGYSIFNILGQEIQQGKLTGTIDLHAEPSGMYLVQLRNDNGQIIGRSQLLKN